MCAGRLTSCRVNPFACHELQMPVHAAKKAKNIAVVGAGPAGMAFAHTAASRGHKVTLFDAQNQIGGQLNIAKQIPGKPEFAETLRYFDQVLDDVGVVRVLAKKWLRLICRALMKSCSPAALCRAKSACPAASGPKC